jgi:hypothetical protein
VVAGVLAVVLLAACGSSGKDEAASTTTTSTTRPSTTATAAPTTDFGRLAAKGAAAKVKVTYALTGGSVPRFTLSQSPPQQAFLTDDIQVILSGDHAVACARTGTKDCVVVPGGSQAAAHTVLTNVFAAPMQALTRIERGVHGRDTRAATVLDRPVTCADVTGEDVEGLTAKGHVEACVDDDTGVLLRWTVDTPAEDSLSFVAVELGEPQPIDFVPPTSPVDVAKPAS